MVGRNDDASETRCIGGLHRDGAMAITYEYSFHCTEALNLAPLYCDVRSLF
jgi:hypothetical protein